MGSWLQTAWSWLNANAAGVGSLAGVAAAIVAIFALLVVGRDSRARAQPRVTAEFRCAADSDSVIDLVVTNVGQTPARQVRVLFEPPLVVPADTSQLTAPYLVQRYSKAIPVLNPSQTLSNVWWSGEARTGGDLVNAEPTPDEVTLTIKYFGLGRRLIIDTYDLTIETVTLTTFAVSTSSFPGRLKTIDASLKQLAKAVAVIAKQRS